MVSTVRRRAGALFGTALLAAAAPVVAATPASASCIPSTSQEQYDRAQVVVEGTFADGPTDPNGVLLRPADFDVARYVKGSGSSRLTVEAGGRRGSDGGYSYTSVDVLPRPGEAWRLYGEMQDDGALATDLCRGSARMTSAYAGACPADVPEDGFVDVAAHDLHEPAIDCAAWRGLVRGTGAGSYAPGSAATRAQLATLVAAALERTGAALPQDPPDAFTDDDGDRHERAINQLAALGVVRGTAAGRYSPAAAVSRAHAVAVLVRAQEQDTGRPLPVTRDHFSDDEHTVHEVDIDKAAEARYVGGTSAQTFSPDAPVTRAQLSSTIVRWVDRRVAGD